MGVISNRAAQPGDGPHLLEFMIMAGEGLPELSWAEMAEPGETIYDVGLRRATRDEGSFSWRNATIFEADGRVVGGMVGYQLDDAPAEIGPEFSPEFVPLQELENIAPGSWYVNILGVYEDARGKGVGTAMLAHAQKLARQGGAHGTSIIAFSSNPGAMRLYLREGYVETARRPMAIPGWAHDGCDAVLLLKD